MLARALGVITFLLVPVVGQAAERIDFGRYHALVIGINAYEDDRLARLETPVNDASAVHDLLLRRYGSNPGCCSTRPATSWWERWRSSATSSPRVTIY